MAPPTSEEFHELKRFIVRAIEHHHAILDRPNVSISVPEPLAGDHVEAGPQDGERFSSCALGKALRSENIDWADFCFRDVEQEEDSGYVGAFSFSPPSGLAIIRGVKKKRTILVSHHFRFREYCSSHGRRSHGRRKSRLIGFVSPTWILSLMKRQRWRSHLPRVRWGVLAPAPSRGPVADSSRPWAVNIEGFTFKAPSIETVFLSTYHIVELLWQYEATFYDTLYFDLFFILDFAFSLESQRELFYTS